MKPVETLARATTPEGDELVLSRRDGVYHLWVAGAELMTSRAHGSEEALSTLALAALGRRKAPRVLVGGLGFGYTLRAALDALPPDASVVVGELLPALLDWHQGELGALAGRPLADRRVEVVLGDVRRLLEGRERFDAVLLDVDNGAEPVTLRSNAGLYAPAGLAGLHGSLAAGGVAGFWASFGDPRFVERLRRAGFEAWAERVPHRQGGRRKNHVIFLARRPS